MKMDDQQLSARVAQLEGTPAFTEFVSGFDPAVLGDPLKTLLLFAAWMEQHHPKTSTPAAIAPAQQQALQPAAAPATAPTTEAAPPTAAPTEGPDGDDADADRRAGRAVYMRYYRSARSPKVPAAVAVKFREACNDRTGKLAAELFAAYIESGENWLSSSVVMEDSQNHNEREGGRWGWCTKEDTRINNISTVVLKSASNCFCVSCSFLRGRGTSCHNRHKALSQGPAGQVPWQSSHGRRTGGFQGLSGKGIDSESPTSFMILFGANLLIGIVQELK